LAFAVQQRKRTPLDGGLTFQVVQAGFLKSMRRILLYPRQPDSQQPLMQLLRI
jgi:hypothetical protein